MDEQILQQWGALYSFIKDQCLLPITQDVLLKTHCNFSSKSIQDLSVFHGHLQPPGAHTHTHMLAKQTNKQIKKETFSYDDKNMRKEKRCTVSV